MPASAKIQLVISEFDGDGSAVTRMLGIEPTLIAVSGDNVPGSPNHSRWIYDVVMPGTESVEGQALALLRFLESRAEQIRQTAARFPASIAICMDEQSSPGFSDLTLVPLVVADVSRLGLGIQLHFGPALANGRDEPKH